MRQDICRLEKEAKAMTQENRRVLILANHALIIYNFRLELVQKLVRDGYEVHVSAPYSDLAEELIKEQCFFYNTDIERHGMNPFHDCKLVWTYRKLIKEINPVIIFSYTIKPNIYGGIASRILRVPLVVNITGLGSAVQNGGMLSFLVLQMYKVALRNVQTVFFQNEENMKFFQKKKIAQGKEKLLPGSGVNLSHFTLQEYPNDEMIRFVFVSRIMKDKGIDEFIETARKIKQSYVNTEFHICGFCEEEYENILKEMEQDGTIIYHGMVKDIRAILKDTSCLILPSYHEGMANVLLEAAAVGRPSIASDIAGCREAIIDKKTGFLVKVKSADDLVEKVEAFIKLPIEKRKEMGVLARKKVEKDFDRQIVVKAYIDELLVRRSLHD